MPRTIVDDLQIKTWTWAGREGDRTLSQLLTVDTTRFDGTDEDAEAAIAKTLACVERSLRRAVTEQRRDKGSRPWRRDVAAGDY